MRIIGWKLGLAEILFLSFLVLIIWEKSFSSRIVACCAAHLNPLYFNRLPRQPWASEWVWGQAQVLADPFSSGVLPWSKDCAPWPEGWKSSAWWQHEHQNSRYSEYRWYSITPSFYEDHSSNSVDTLLCFRHRKWVVIRAMFFALWIAQFM